MASPPQTRPIGPERALPVLIGASLGALLLFTAIAAAVVAQLEVVARFDVWLGTALHDLAVGHPWLVSAALVLEAVGSVRVSTAVVVLVVVLILGLGLTGRLRPTWPFVVGFLIASAIGGALLIAVIKEAVDRTRPPWNGLWSLESSPSFPSGHAQGGIAVWCALGVVAILLLHGWVRWVVGGILLVLGPTIGFSRLILGVHWPTDVLGGWMFGSFWLLACAAVALSLARRSAATDETEPHPVVADQHQDSHNNGGDDRETRP